MSTFSYHGTTRLPGRLGCSDNWQDHSLIHSFSGMNRNLVDLWDGVPSTALER